MRAAYLALATLFAFAQIARTQDADIGSPPRRKDFEQQLRDVRFELHIDNGKFSGNGASVLLRAIAEAKYVLVGEDHITHEIPQFTTVVCDVMGGSLSAMVVESGPKAAEFVSRSLDQPDRLNQMATLLHKYPDSLAFLNIREENDLAAHCAGTAQSSSFHLWGLDQEFEGSAGWLLDQILATNPGPTSARTFTRLKAEEEQAATRADQSGDWSKLFMFTASDSELADAAAQLQHDGSSAASAIFRELLESRSIYRKNAQGLPESNSERARLLKQNLRQDLASSGVSGGQKALVKFGEMHLYRGFNPLHQRDLGNYIAEVADAEGSTSLHICVLGAAGMHRLYAGYHRPTRLEKFRLAEGPDYLWLKPAVDNQLPGAWSLFDLRQLRFKDLRGVGTEMERLIYGYDLLVLVPELTPAEIIQ